MIQRSVTHASFTIERVYPTTPKRVFAAWADPKAKARWFDGPADWQTLEATFDFRVGGRETNRGGPKDGQVHSFNATYHDIVLNERIIYSYDMHLDETRISVSLATVEFKAEFKPDGTNTKLIFTEQGAFLDGYDNPLGREYGTREFLDALEVELRQQMLNA
jgi:uncharacterized protein YndB with AHSA1/START domain